MDYGYIILLNDVGNTTNGIVYTGKQTKGQQQWGTHTEQFDGNPTGLSTQSHRITNLEMRWDTTYSFLLPRSIILQSHRSDPLQSACGTHMLHGDGITCCGTTSHSSTSQDWDLDNVGLSPSREGQCIDLTYTITAV